MALLAGTALIAAACGSDDDSGSGDTTAATEAPGTEAPSSEAPPAARRPAPVARRPPSGHDVTIDINPDAVWDDGTPITSADFECTWQATLNTPGSSRTVGYDKITSIDAGDSDRQVVVVVLRGRTRRTRTCSERDASRPTPSPTATTSPADLRDSDPVLGPSVEDRVVEPDQLILVPNENYWGEEDKPIADPGRHGAEGRQRHRDRLAEVRRGRLHLPAGLRRHHRRARTTRTSSSRPGYGTNYEGLYFQQLDGPFADDDFRQAFAKSIDRDADPASIYDPIFPGCRAAAAAACGCRRSARGATTRQLRRTAYDPAGAEALLDRRRLGEGRRRLLGQGRRRPRDPLDGQHRQQAP